MQVDKVVTVAGVTVSNEANVTVAMKLMQLLAMKLQFLRNGSNTRLWQPSWLRETNVKFLFQ